MRSEEGPSTETTARTASRTKELEEPFAKYCEEKPPGTATLYEYDVANKQLERKFGERGARINCWVA